MYLKEHALLKVRYSVYNYINTRVRAQIYKMYIYFSKENIVGDFDITNNMLAQLSHLNNIIHFMYNINSLSLC